MTDRFDTSDAETEPEWMRRKAFKSEQDMRDATKRACLIQLFDAAADVECDVSIFERSEPLAESVLRLWASARNLPIVERVFELGSVASVHIGTRSDHEISVYRRQR